MQGPSVALEHTEKSVRISVTLLALNIKQMLLKIRDEILFLQTNNSTVLNRNQKEIKATRLVNSMK